LHLAATERAFVHELVKWMAVVITVFSDGVESGDEIFFGERQSVVSESFVRRFFMRKRHRVNSIPS